jgi:hypothetical protein
LLIFLAAGLASMDWVDEEARFASSSFVAADFVKEAFVENTVEEVEQIRRDLQDKRAATSAELVQIVQKNYVRFSDTAKESAAVETELSGLRGLMSELLSSLVALKTTAAFGFESRKESTREAATSAKTESKEEEASRKARVQYVAEAELELDVLLSERRLEAAVALLEQAQGPLEVLRKRLLAERDTMPSEHLTLSRMECRITQVAEALTLQLTSPAISVTEARVVVGLLKRMHLEPKAKEVFLSGRSQHIVSGIKQLKPDANRPHFVRVLARLVFFALREACNDYTQCFGESANSLSTLSVWCMKETQAFGLLWIRFVVARGVTTAGSGSTELSQCLAEALSCVRVLEPFGLFFDKLLRKQLLAAVVQKYERLAQKHIEMRVADRLQKEDFYATPQLHRGLFEVTSGDQVKKGDAVSLLTPSAVACIRAVYVFVRDAVTDLPQELLRPVAQISLRMAEGYVGHLSARLDAPLNDQQLLGLIGNAVALVNLLGVEVDRLLAPKTTVLFVTQLSQLFDQFCQKLCERKASFLLNRSWQFSYLLYADVRAMPSASSRQALKLLEWVKLFRARLMQQISSSVATSDAITDLILTRLLASLVDQIRDDSDETFWSRAGELSREAVVQFALDLRWIQEASAALKLTNAKMGRAIEASVQCALLEFCNSKGVRNPKEVLPPPTFFKDIIAQQLQALNQPQ